MRRAMNENCDERFLSAVNEVKAIYGERSKEGQELKNENKKLQRNIEELKIEKQDLTLKQESLVQKMKILEENLDKSNKDLEKVTDELADSKKFLKNFFKDLQDRMKELEHRGIYNAKTFSYLTGHIGKTLHDSSFAGKLMNSPTKKQSTSKLSTNKEKKRFRYKDIAPLELDQVLLKPIKQNNAVQNASAILYQEVYENRKNCQPRDRNEVMDTNNDQNQNAFDPDSTLRSPIGPPSKASTPQDHLSGEESKKFQNVNLMGGFQQTSPSLLSGECVEQVEGMEEVGGMEEVVGMEDAESMKALLPAFLSSLEEDIPELSEPQSPTIPSRSHSITRNKTKDASIETRKTKRKRDLDLTFGSLLAEPQNSGVSSHHPNKTATITETVQFIQSKAKTGERNVGCKKQVQPLLTSSAISPDIIILEDSGFVKPNSVLSVSRKKSKTCSVNETRLNSSSLILFSPQRSDSPVTPSKISRVSVVSNETHRSEDSIENELANDDKPRIPFHLNMDETGMEEKSPERPEDKSKPYKYVEVVRGKANREKLNGYFCRDCEEYYGCLPLTEQEKQERLKMCSRHRARFSPPPATPEHFWEVDFMNTNEYIEKGFMRTESDLPAEKRKLKSRKTKGKLARK